MEEISLSMGKVLLVYGPLGIMALAGLLFGIRKDKELKLARESFDKERTTWQERYVSKAEAWAEQYQDLARSINLVLESLSKQRRR